MNIKDMTIAVVDIETTGFFKKGGLITEVGIAVLETSTGKITTVFDSLCKEDGFGIEHRDAWIFSNSDMQYGDVYNAPHLSDIADEIQNCLHSCDAATAYNKAFDFEFLRDRGFNIGLEAQCPMIVGTDVCKIPSMNRYSRYKWPKVQEAYDFLFPNSGYIETHRGADDAAHEAEIVMELINRNVLNIEEIK